MAVVRVLALLLAGLDILILVAGCFPRRTQIGFSACLKKAIPFARSTTVIIRLLRYTVLKNDDLSAVSQDDFGVG